MSLQELRKTPEFKDKFSGFRTKSNDTVTKIASRKFNFWIETDKLLVTQKGNYNSLTFKVFRDVPGTKLENLFLHPYNGGYLPYLISYNFDAKDLQDFEAGLLIANILEKMEILPLTDFDMTGLGLPVATFGGPGDGYSGTYQMIDGVCCTVVTDVNAEGETTYGWRPCAGCECPGNSNGAETVQRPGIMFIDYRRDYGSAVGSGNGGGGVSAGSGEGGIFNPSNGSHPPGADESGQTPNGLPVLGIFGPGSNLNKAANAQKTENQITSGDSDDCSNSVIQDLKKLTDYDIAKIITRLDSYPSPYKLEIKTEAFSTTDGSPAETRRTPGYTNYNYTTKLHPDFMGNSTKLGRASIIIHEIIHAYFLSLIDDQGAGDPNATYEITELFEAYVTKTFGPNSAMIQHQVMAEKYVDAIGRALQEYNTGIPIALGQNPEQVYTDIAWGGLRYAPVYSTLPTVDQDRIQKRFAAETLNMTIGTEMPIGEPCD